MPLRAGGGGCALADFTCWEKTFSVHGSIMTRESVGRYGVYTPSAIS